MSGWTAPQSSGRKFLPAICVKTGQLTSLDARDRVILIAYSLVIAAIRIASARWWSYQNTEIGSHRPVPAFVVLRFELRDWRSFM